MRYRNVETISVPFVLDEIDYQSMSEFVKVIGRPEKIEIQVEDWEKLLPYCGEVRHDPSGPFVFVLGTRVYPRRGSYHGALAVPTRLTKDES